MSWVASQSCRVCVPGGVSRSAVFTAVTTFAVGQRYGDDQRPPVAVRSLEDGCTDAAQRWPGSLPGLVRIELGEQTVRGGGPAVPGSILGRKVSMEKSHHAQPRSPSDVPSGLETSPTLEARPEELHKTRLLPALNGHWLSRGPSPRARGIRSACTVGAEHV